MRPLVIAILLVVPALIASQPGQALGQALGRAIPEMYGQQGATHPPITQPEYGPQIPPNFDQHPPASTCPTCRPRCMPPIQGQPGVMMVPGWYAVPGRWVTVLRPGILGLRYVPRRVFIPHGVGHGGQDSAGNYQSGPQPLQPSPIYWQ